MNKKISKVFLMFFLFIQFGCDKDPTYNPFDQEFDISIRQVFKNGCDTIPAGCGYFNLTERSATSKMYYQIYSDDLFEVVAKGYVYHVDTFRFKSRKDYYNKRQVNEDSIFQLQFNISNLNQKIEKYSYAYFDRARQSVRILDESKQDTVVLEFRMVETDDPRYFVRNLQYFEGSPRK